MLGLVSFWRRTRGSHLCKLSVSVFSVMFGRSSYTQCVFLWFMQSWHEYWCDHKTGVKLFFPCLSASLSLLGTHSCDRLTTLGLLGQLCHSSFSWPEFPASCTSLWDHKLSNTVVLWNTTPWPVLSCCLETSCWNSVPVTCEAQFSFLDKTL